MINTRKCERFQKNTRRSHFKGSFVRGLKFSIKADFRSVIFVTRATFCDRLHGCTCVQRCFYALIRSARSHKKVEVHTTFCDRSPGKIITSQSKSSKTVPVQHKHNKKFSNDSQHGVVNHNRATSSRTQSCWS